MLTISYYWNLLSELKMKIESMILEEETFARDILKRFKEGISSYTNTFYF